MRARAPVEYGRGVRAVTYALCSAISAIRSATFWRIARCCGWSPTLQLWPIANAYSQEAMRALSSARRASTSIVRWNIGRTGGSIKPSAAGLPAQARARRQAGRHAHARDHPQHEPRRLRGRAGERNGRGPLRAGVGERPHRLVAARRGDRDADPAPGPVDVALVVERYGNARELA